MASSLRSELTPMPERAAMCWTVRFDARNPMETLRVDGRGCSISQTGEGRHAVVEMLHADHVLVSATAGAASVRAGPATLPVYSWVRDGRVELSNRAAELMTPHDVISISSWVLLQQLLGANYPQHNLFADIELLEANGVYDATSTGLRYAGTALTCGDDADLPEVLARIYAGFDQALGDRPICVLLSAGYDSRFNLALALRRANETGRPVYAFHEYKDEGEQGIAKAIAERAGVPLHMETRQSFSALAAEQVFDPEYVRFHSGTYRDNVPRWHAYLGSIRDRVPDGVILGLGAEAHKGKFYGQMHDLRLDGERVFGTDPTRITGVAKSLGLRDYDRESQHRYFDTLCAHSESFADHFSRVDFLHYHTYVVNGYGHRCYDFQQFFDMPFPLLEEPLLATIFRMPGELKRDFRIVREGLADLAPWMLEIPFLSGNAKALKTTSPGRRLLDEPLNVLRALKRSVVRGPTKGKMTPALLEKVRSLINDSRSEITGRLFELLQGNPQRQPLRADYVLQVFLYLRMLEAEKNVTIRCV